MGKERRRSKRYESNLFVQFDSGSLKHDKVRGVVVNVSKTGFAVESEADLEYEGEYGCHIEIPFALRVKVVRRSVLGHLKRYGMVIVGSGFLDKLMLGRLLRGLKQTGKV